MGKLGAATAQQRDVGTAGGPGTTTERAARWAFRSAVVVAVLPIAVAAVRALADGWYAVSDDALFPIRARDVFSAHPPLLGTWSSASGAAGINVNHLGPLLFYLLAVPVRIFGPSAGTVITVAYLNALAVVAVAWLAQRRAGVGFAVATMAGVAGMEWAMGGPTLFDPWNPHAAVLPWCALIFAAWSVIDGDLVAGPIGVFAGSLALQLHLSYVVVVPVVMAVALVGWFAIRHWAGDWSKERDATDRRGRLLIAAGVLLVVLWLPPLWQQAFGHPGNVSQLAKAEQKHVEPPIGLSRGVRTVGAVVALPPWFLPPGWDRPSFSTVRLGQDRSFRYGAIAGFGALAGFVAALVVVGERARRRRNRSALTGSAFGVVLLVAGVVTASQASSPFGSIEEYVRWLWPVAVFCWLQVGWGAVAFVRDRWAGRPSMAWQRPRPALAGTALGVVACLVAAVGAFGGTDRGSGSIPWARNSSRDVAAQAGRALRGNGPVLLHQKLDIGAYAVEPSVLLRLDERGVRYYVDDPALSHQLGSSRLYRGQHTTFTAWFASGDGAVSVPAHAVRMAFHRELDSADEASMRRLRDELTVQLVAGGLPITKHGRQILTKPRNAFAGHLISRARTDPTALLGAVTVQFLLLNDMVPTGDPVHRLLIAYEPLIMKWELQTVAMFVAPTGSADAPKPNRYQVPAKADW